MAGHREAKLLQLELRVYGGVEYEGDGPGVRELLVESYCDRGQRRSSANAFVGGWAVGEEWRQLSRRR